MVRTKVSIFLWSLFSPQLFLPIKHAKYKKKNLKMKNMWRALGLFCDGRGPRVLASTIGRQQTFVKNSLWGEAASQRLYWKQQIWSRDSYSQSIFSQMIFQRFTWSARCSGCRIMSNVHLILETWHYLLLTRCLFVHLSFFVCLSVSDWKRWWVAVKENHLSGSINPSPTAFWNKLNQRRNLVSNFK